MGYRNSEGYIDPTAGDAINGVRKKKSRECERSSTI